MNGWITPDPRGPCRVTRARSRPGRCEGDSAGRWHETPDGHFKVGTPELTALELVERASLVGGMSTSSEIDAAFKVRLAADPKSANA